MPQEIQEIIINIGWLTFAIGILCGLPVLIIGVYYYNTTNPKRLPKDDVFRWFATVSVLAFVLAFTFWIVAWIN